MMASVAIIARGGILKKGEMSKIEFVSAVRELARNKVPRSDWTYQLALKMGFSRRTAQEWLLVMKKNGTLAAIEANAEKQKSFDFSNSVPLHSKSATISKVGHPSVRRVELAPTDLVTVPTKFLQDLAVQIQDLIASNKEVIESLKQYVGGTAKKPPAQDMSDSAVAARRDLSRTIESYAATLHPKTDGISWPETTSGCIKDLKHRVKAEMGVTEWDQVNWNTALIGAEWLAKVTKSSKFDALVVRLRQGTSP